uniref:Uncharacterized protein n=1 Tax=viral metagenome TaxID=1070528 RepID=A0A6C0E1H4_9ZZZZ
MGMVISHVIIQHNLFNNVKKQKIYQEKKDEYQYYKLEDEILISNTS